MDSISPDLPSLNVSTELESSDSSLNKLSSIAFPPIGRDCQALSRT